ncbi:MAG: hypothetical protein DMD35_04810 [Gemmatimonadetes bacterium]|nr:MAG: hypothetical protein DMD35_04810 [Gemmatimonadota bacterium]
MDDAISPLKHITWIDVQVDVGWMDPNTAYGQAIVRYGANNAVADVDLSVRNAQGTLLATSTGHAQASYFLPGDHTLYASTNAYVAQTCRAAAQATARGNVFDSFLTTTQSLASWGQKAETSGRTATQPACAYLPPPTSPTGGDGSTTPPTGGTTQPPTYQPAPFVPSGHWECVVYYRGTDYERQYCTWYADYARLPRTSPAFALIGGGATLRTLTSVDLPRLFVIVSDQVPADAMAVIERGRQGPFKNVLLVPSSTVRPAVLVAALRALADSRSRQGETPSTDLQLTLKGGVLDQQIPAAARDYAASFTTLIANAKRGDAGAYGTRPLLEIQLGDMK